MTFLVDENPAVRSAVRLRGANHDATHVSEDALTGADAIVDQARRAQEQASRTAAKRPIGLGP